MRIDIVDLPVGQRIKHLNIDITFDENNNAYVNTQHTTEQIKQTGQTEPKNQDNHVPSGLVDMVNLSSVKNPVPLEMTDIEL